MSEAITLFNSQGQRLYLNSDERLRLQQAARQSDDSLAEYFCLMLLNTGCRLSEAIALTPASIDLNQGVVIFKTLKRRKIHYRTVPLSPEFLKELKLKFELKQNTASKFNTPLWPYSRTTAWRRVKEFMDQAKITGAMATPKGLRHGFGVACIEKDIPITVIQKWLGHSSPTTTAIYLQVVGAEERSFANRLWR